MLNTRIQVLFGSLSGPANAAEGPTFSAYPIPGFERYRIAMDVDGNAALLAEVPSAVSERRQSPTVLENLRVEHSLLCRVLRPDGPPENGSFSVVTCTSIDLQLRNHFIRIASLVVEAIGTEPTQRLVVREFQNLVELFRALASPPRKTVQGLWAELFIIARSRRSDLLLDAWHSRSGDRVDFNAGEGRIEVKSCSDRSRRHHFSLDQLQTPAGSTLLVASVFVERSGAGRSLADLIDSIRGGNPNRPDLLFRLETVVAQSLGTQLRQSIDDRFDWELASDQLRFIDSARVPRPTGDLPAQVSDVRFLSDLAEVESADLSTLRHGLFAAIGRPRE